MQGEAEALAWPGARPQQPAKPGQVPAKLCPAPWGWELAVEQVGAPAPPPGTEKGGTRGSDPAVLRAFLPGKPLYEPDARA